MGGNLAPHFRLLSDLAVHHGGAGCPVQLDLPACDLLLRTGAHESECMHVYSFSLTYDP